MVAALCLGGAALYYKSKSPSETANSPTSTAVTEQKSAGSAQTPVAAASEQSAASSGPATSDAAPASQPQQSAASQAEPPAAGGAAPATPPSPETPSPKAGAAASAAAAPGSYEARYENLALWAALKRDYPDWYATTMKEAGAKPDQAARDKHMLEQLVALRRKHAREALAAGTDRLRTIASTFLKNLKALAQIDSATCYGFISQGETSPVIVSLMQKPEQTEPFQTQFLAILDAIAEGQKGPKAHTAPGKGDYDMLASELSLLGWSQQDLAIFANAQALAKLSPSRVCRMVQDWFFAHLSIKDEAVQGRLLVETLKPVVSG